jgi:hypothetical protein
MCSINSLLGLCLVVALASLGISAAAADPDGPPSAPEAAVPADTAAPELSPTEPSQTSPAGAGRAAEPSKPDQPTAAGERAGPDNPGAENQGATGAATTFVEAVCWAIGREAVANDLPIEFFTRLIWQESRFDPRARSHVGAEGIAQFMPRTAQWRGLADSFEPFQALRESARWLAELRDQFGNLGLAAAAYNGGPGRVAEWLAGRGGLPGETRAYVRIITGREAEDWKGAKDEDVRLARRVPCTQIARLLAAPEYPSRGARARGPSQPPRDEAWGPWGLQLIGNWSERVALSDYEKLQAKFPAVLGDKKPMVVRSRMAGRGSATWVRVRVAESTRERANQLCAKLEAAGGKCIVFRN